MHLKANPIVDRDSKSSTYHSVRKHSTNKKSKKSKNESVLSLSATKSHYLLTSSMMRNSSILGYKGASEHKHWPDLSTRIFKNLLPDGQSLRKSEDKRDYPLYPGYIDAYYVETTRGLHDMGKFQPSRKTQILLNEAKIRNLEQSIMTSQSINNESCRKSQHDQSICISSSPQKSILRSSEKSQISKKEDFNFDKLRRDQAYNPYSDYSQTWTAEKTLDERFTNISLNCGTKNSQNKYPMVASYPFIALNGPIFDDLQSIMFTVLSLRQISTKFILSLKGSLLSFFEDLILRRKSQYMSKFEFNECLARFGISGDSIARDCLFKIFDRSRDGMICYDDFEALVCSDTPNLRRLCKGETVNANLNIDWVAGPSYTLFRDFLEILMEISCRVYQFRRTYEDQLMVFEKQPESQQAREEVQKLSDKLSLIGEDVEFMKRNVLYCL